VNGNSRVVLDACVLANFGLCDLLLTLATSNLKHFPPEALQPWDVCACHPADYLITLYSLNAGLVVARLEEIARKRKRTPEEHVALLGKSVPSFAAHLAEAVGWDLPYAGA
jgi:hypothetical protein